MSKKTYIAYTMYDIERGCGCSECIHVPVYDRYGDNHKKFDTRKEAEEAAVAAMIKRDDDRWNVI